MCETGQSQSQAAPRDDKSVASWPDRDEALADVAKQVRQVVEGNGAVASELTKAYPVASVQTAGKPIPQRRYGYICRKLGL